MTPIRIAQPDSNEHNVTCVDCGHTSPWSEYLRSKIFYGLSLAASETGETGERKPWITCKHCGRPYEICVGKSADERVLAYAGAFTIPRRSTHTHPREESNQAACFLVFPDPWYARCLAQALPGAHIVTFGTPHARTVLATVNNPTTFLPGEGRLTMDLLRQARFQQLVSNTRGRVLYIQNTAWAEKMLRSLGASVAMPPAAVSVPLHNKLQLAGLAQESGVSLLKQALLPCVGPIDFDTLAQEYGLPFIVQRPRGGGGNGTCLVETRQQLADARKKFTCRNLRISRFEQGVSGTLNCVVDHRGAVMYTAPIVQITGVPWLTSKRFASCGNDLTWRLQPNPGDGPGRLARALGATLARRGYTGHFGLDFVVSGTHNQVRTWLVEINPRLTMGLYLYSAWCPAIIRAHLLAVGGGRIEAGELPPIEGGQIIFDGASEAPPDNTRFGLEQLPRNLEPHQVTNNTLWDLSLSTQPGQLRQPRHYLIRRGALVDAHGTLSPLLRSLAGPANQPWQPVEAPSSRG